MKNNRQSTIKRNVEYALLEDIGSGDITAQLIPSNKQARATVITRESGVLCGTQWVDEVFAQISDNTTLTWNRHDSDSIEENEVLFTLEGSARAILSGERSALNFLQTLSGTATTSRHYAQLVAHTPVKLLDTRKTLPGLRVAQKYAVTCGGCHNHRIGLFDAFLIKEDHILTCGSILKAVQTAREISPNKSVEIEVESLEEFAEALHAQADIVMLDNFTPAKLKEAVAMNRGQAKLEASGGITSQTLVPIAETGVDYISIGALTKDCQSIDLSMRVSL